MMPVRLKLSTLSLVAALTAPGLLVSGCGNEANTPEAKTAEEAAGIKPDGESQKTVQTTQDVIVKKETTVIEKNTGKILSDKTETTPVKIIQQTVEKKDVKVDVGDTKTTGDLKTINEPKK